MNLDQFDFELPEHLIATSPATPRDHSRLLLIPPGEAAFQHLRFTDLEHLLEPGDLLVMNETKVFPARLFAEDASGKSFEVFLLKSLSPDLKKWECLVRPGKRVKAGLELRFPGDVSASVTRDGDRFFIEFGELPQVGFFAWAEAVGQTPLPPYIKRKPTWEDLASYQTVYAKVPGSIAAPTAGLHFTPALLERLRAKGVGTATLCLHVGYGTFSPIRVQNIDEHVMHEEYFEIPEETYERVLATRAAGRRVIAVGTTSLRALESASAGALQGSTSIFIKPGYRLKLATGLITNFHLPQSSLFILVTALLGPERARAAYTEAIAEGYRFYSYGDAMAFVG